MDLEREALRIRRRAAERAAELEREQAGLREAEARVNERLTQLKALRSRIDLRQGELKVGEGQIERYETQMLQLKSAQDMERMKTQIATKRAELSQAEDRILELMQAAEEGENGLAAFRRAADERVQRCRTRQATADHETATESARLAAMASARSAAEAGVGPELLSSYRARSAATGECGAALCQAGFCSACGTRLSPQCEAAARADKLPDCPSCQRLLLPEPAQG